MLAASRAEENLALRAESYAELERVQAAHVGQLQHLQREHAAERRSKQVAAAAAEAAAAAAHDGRAALHLRWRQAELNEGRAVILPHAALFSMTIAVKVCKHATNDIATRV